MIKDIIEYKLSDAFSLDGLEVINESHMHNVPPGSESHFKVILVTDEFEGQKLVHRHKRVNEVLANELENNVHALSLQTLTPSEWLAKGGKLLPSPKCLGGSKDML